MLFFAFFYGCIVIFICAIKVYLSCNRATAVLQYNSIYYKGRNYDIRQYRHLQADSRMSRRLRRVKKRANRQIRRACQDAQRRVQHHRRRVFLVAGTHRNRRKPYRPQWRQGALL